MIATKEFTTPYSYNKKVQEINASLNDLGWIEKIYPIVWRGEEEEGTFPEAYNNDGTKKNIRVMPEGKAISFFQIEGDMVEIDEYYFNTTMSITVWGDLRKIYKTKKYDYTIELINSIVSILRFHSCTDISINVDDVFSDFSLLQKQINQNTMRPYAAFKITFNTLLTICIN